MIKKSDLNRICLHVTAVRNRPRRPRLGQLLLQVLWAKMESEEVRFQTAVEDWERICSSDCDGKCVP